MVLLVQTPAVHYGYCFLLSSVGWNVWLLKSCHCHLVQLVFNLHVQSWNGFHRLAVAYVRFTDLLLYWWTLKLQIWCPIKKNARLPKNRHIKIIFMWSHWFHHRLTTHTRTVIILLVIVPYHVHSNGSLIPQTCKASVSAWKMRRMSLLKLFNNFHLLFYFHFSLLKQNQQLFHCVLLVDFGLVLNHLCPASKSQWSDRFVFVNVWGWDIYD